jgi:PTH1 family peptidyl-tRNA hydrolase
MAAQKIIVGLGNPGRGYVDTRHNAGWMAVEEVAAHVGPVREEFRGDGMLGLANGVLLFKPLLMMNRSGPPVARLMRETGAGLDELLVLTDDLNLPLGAVRLRPGGSSGGHKGLASLIEALGGDGFARVRMGIGPLPGGVDAADFVLSPFEDAEWDAVDEMAQWAAGAALCWLVDGVEAAMNRFNRGAENGQGV